MIRLDVLAELLQTEEEEERPRGTGSPRWAAYAAKYNHDTNVCACVGCKRFRGDAVRVSPRAKHSRQRGYVWLTDTDDLRVRRAAARVGMSNAEFVRHAVLLRLKQVEDEA